METFLIIATIIAIVILIYLIKDKNEQIARLTQTREFLDDEILKLKNSLENGERIIRVNSQNSTETINALRAEIAKQTHSATDKYNRLAQRYVKLMHTYMFARKKSEIEVMAEFEQAIAGDYESLGSQNVYATSYIASAMADFYTMQIKNVENDLRRRHQQSRSDKIADVRKEAAALVEHAKKCQYSMEAALAKILRDHPEISEDYLRKNYGIVLDDILLDLGCSEAEKNQYLRQISNLNAKYEKLETKFSHFEEDIEHFEQYTNAEWQSVRSELQYCREEFSSNLTAFPYMSRIIADIMTIDIDKLAFSLSWGNNQERKRKVASLNALKKEKAEEIERIKWAEYQLAYLLELYPNLQEVLDTEFKDLEISYEQIEDYDPVRRFIDHEEWEKMSVTERNQAALDRYVESRKKSKWQIGRDYELYCGYRYEQQGFTVDYYGSYHGLEDLGRDLIVQSGNDIRIVQCKYWSQNKQIHENHIMQLYGSVIEYNLEHGKSATGILITNTVLSDKAKEFARILGVDFKERMPLGEFPRIKCNIGVGEYGERTQIYHLPFDQQYDATKVDGNGEFMAFTVAEAERAGFRRAYRWHGAESFS